MAAVHGFIAGWGLGALALIMATVLVPTMPSAALGWVPGTAFGLGTTAVLAGAGAVIGALIRHQRLPERLAQEGARWTLLVRGLLFAAAWVAGLAVPSIRTAGISNLNGDPRPQPRPDRRRTLVLALVVVVAAVTIWRTVHQLRRMPTDVTPPAPPDEAAGRHGDAAPGGSDGRVEEPERLAEEMDTARRRYGRQERAGAGYCWPLSPCSPSRSVALLPTGRSTL